MKFKLKKSVTDKMLHAIYITLPANIRVLRRGTFNCTQYSGGFCSPCGPRGFIIPRKYLTAVRPKK